MAAPSSPNKLVLTVGPSVVGGAGIQLDLQTIAAFGLAGAAAITEVAGAVPVTIAEDAVISQIASALHAAVPASVVLHEPTSAVIDTFVQTKDKSLVVVDVEAPTDAAWHCASIVVTAPASDAGADVAKAVAALHNDRTAIAVLEGRGTHSLDDIRAALGESVQQVWLDGGDHLDTIEVLGRYRRTMTPDNGDRFVVDVVHMNGDVFAFVSRANAGEIGRRKFLAGALAASVAADGLTHQSIARAIQFARTANALSAPSAQPDLSHSTWRRLVPPPSPQNPHPFVSYLISTCPDLWKSYVRHPFVRALGDGTLPKAKFQRYIIQDYHYLQHYARAHSLGAYKSTTFAEIQAFNDITGHIVRESSMHVSFCESFGVSLPEILATPESVGCGAYARFIMDAGAQGDVLDLYMAVFSCLIGYGEVGMWLRKQIAAGAAKLDGNPYRKWIEDYSGEDFLAAVDRGIENLEKRIAADPPSPARLERLVHIWKTCVRLEGEFWEG
ncbi:trifunctional hydroxymethylpyrimidine kinase/phosphomethylpyrimidine kinase/thiaminase [Cryptotrichosporon argae]